MKQFTYSPTLKTTTVRWSSVRKTICAWNLIRVTPDVFAIATSSIVPSSLLTSINKYFSSKSKLSLKTVITLAERYGNKASL